MIHICMAHDPHPHYLCDYNLPFKYLGMSHRLTAVYLYIILYMYRHYGPPQSPH